MGRTARTYSFSATVFFSLSMYSFAAAAPVDSVSAGVEQLRHVIGEWGVVTEFLNPDGSVAQSVSGTYKFEWVINDRVVSGRSEIPSQQRSAALLFYVNEQKKTIEMASVGVDGHLWIMTGSIGGETRITPPTAMSDGSTMQLRFTRYNIERDRFESRMERTTDDGATWLPGNHQVFLRKK